MMNFKRGKLFGGLILMSAAIVWGLSFVAQSVGSDTLGVFSFNGIRCTLGGLTLLPFVIVNDRKDKKRIAAGGLKVTDRPSLRYALGSGVVCGLVMGIAVNSQQYAFYTCSPGKVGFLTALYILLVPIFGLFIGKKTSLTIWISVTAGAFGLYLLCTNGSGFSASAGELKGELAALAGAVFFAVQILLVDHYVRRESPVLLSCIQFLTVGIVSLIFMFIFERPTASDVRSALIPLLYSGILSCGLGFTCQSIGQKYTPPAVASLIMCFESVFSVIFSFLILHERLTGRELLGCAVMFAAVLATNIPVKRKSSYAGGQQDADGEVLSDIPTQEDEDGI